MSKTFLVAQREFMENMKTKTFWLGILAAPVMIVIVYGAMFLLANKTDVRKYVVLDYSKSEEFGDQWVSKRIQEDLSKNQLSGVFQALTGSDEEKAAAGKKLADAVAELPADHPIRDLMKRIEDSGLMKDLEAADVKAGEIPLGVQAIASKWMLEVAFDPDKKDAIRSLVDDLAAKDFQRVDFEDQGEDNEKILNQMLQDGKIFAYIVIGEDPLAKDHGSKYVSQNVSDRKLRNWYGGMATELIRQAHIDTLRREKNLSKADVANIKRRFDFEEKKLSETGEEEDVQNTDRTRQFAPIAFVYALWMSIFIAAQMLLTNTVEEKSNRIIEVLLSSVSPTELMHGKIYGIAATGLTIVGSWAMFFVLGIKIAPTFLPQDGAAKFAEFGLDAIATDPVFVASFLAYFLTGYLFYAAVLVAIGSVCNSLKEAQNLQQPVVFMLFVPFVTMFPIAQDPNGTIAKVVTYIPLYTPFAMMNRAGDPPPTWEYIVSSIVILVSLWIAFRGAAKVFRVGVLMTGKPPKFTEIIKWMRAPTR